MNLGSQMVKIRVDNRRGLIFNTGPYRDLLRNQNFEEKKNCILERTKNRPVPKFYEYRS